MFLGDKGRPTEYKTQRLNFDIIIDNERMTLHKLSTKLGFFSIVYAGRIREIETIYDTDGNLLTSAGLLIRKKTFPERTYFSLVRISSVSTGQDREKKSFLGECEPNDQPSDFPVQIADEINNVFNNLFTINLVDVVKHCKPYIRMEVGGNRYRVVSGTGYEAEIEFESVLARNAKNGRKEKVRIFSLKLPLIAGYEKERQQILDAIDRYCKELDLLTRNRFEICQALTKDRVPKENPEVLKQAKGKKKDKKKNNREEQEGQEE